MTLFNFLALEVKVVFDDNNFHLDYILNNFGVDAQRSDYRNFRKAREIKKEEGQFKSFKVKFMILLDLP